MITEEQFKAIDSKLDRLSARSIPIPKKNGPDWTKIVGVLIVLLSIAASIVVGYIVQTKAEAATQHQEMGKTFESKEHAKEVHDRHDEAAEKVTGKIDALYEHVINRKPRSSVRVSDDGGDDGD